MSFQRFIGLSIVVFLCINVVQGQELSYIHARWNPNGELVAFAFRSQIHIRDDLLQDIVTLDLLDAEPQIYADIYNVAWNSDGSKLAALGFPNRSGESARLIVWDTVSWQITDELINAGQDIAFSPDGFYIATITNLSVVIYELGTEVIVNRTRIRDSVSLAWNPSNNNELVVQNTFGDESNIRIINPFTGEVIQELDYEASIHPSYSPDGQYLVLSRSYYNTSIIDVLDTTNYEVVSSLTVDNGLFQAQESIFWINTRTIATSSLQGESITWDVLTNESYVRNQQLEADFVFAPIGWSPDGSRYYYYVNDSEAEMDALYILHGITGNILAQRLETSQSYIQSIFLADDAQNRIPLSNGTTFNLAETTNTMLTALTEPDEIGSVLFDLSGSTAITQVDNTAPYELSDWTPTSGMYTLTVTPYTEANGTGTTGIPMTLEFTIAVPE